MKKNKIYAGLIFTLVVFSSLALWSCGGGGGGDTPETNTALTADNSPDAAAGVLKAMDIADALQGLSGLMTTTSSTTSASSSTSPISNIVNMTAAALKNGQQAGNSYTAGSIPSWYSYELSCSGGGTMVLSDASWEGPDEPTADDMDEVVNFTGQVTFNSCKKSTLTLNGTVDVSVTGPLTSPTAVTMSGSLSYTDTSNSTTINLSNANLAVTGIGTDFDMDNATIVLTGSVQATVGGENISFRGNGFTVVVSGGNTISLSGKIRTACLETWLTITTNTPATIASGTCPTAGDFSASYNGNTVRAVIAGGGSNISLYFNGTQLPTTYASCTELKGACGL